MGVCSAQTLSLIAKREKVRGGAGSASVKFESNNEPSTLAALTPRTADIALKVNAEVITTKVDE